MQMEEAGGGGREQGVQSPGESHRPKHPPQERVTASMGLPEGGSPAVTPHSCWEASPRRQFPTATRQGGRGRSRPGSPAEIQFPCGDGFPWNDSPQGPTLAEARQLRNRNREHQRRADKEGTSICDPQPRVGGTGSDFRPETTETKQRRGKKKEIWARQERFSYQPRFPGRRISYAALRLGRGRLQPQTPLLPDYPHSPGWRRTERWARGQGFVLQSRVRRAELRQQWAPRMRPADTDPAG